MKIEVMARMIHIKVLLGQGIINVSEGNKTYSMEIKDSYTFFMILKKDHLMELFTEKELNINPISETGLKIIHWLLEQDLIDIENINKE